MAALGVTITTNTLFILAGYCIFGLANHVPQFSREINVINVPEEQPIGTHLLNVAATDADGDAIEYSLDGKNIEYLNINHRSGDIKTARIIDREKIVRLDFQVVASEVKNPSRRSIQRIIIHVIDKNDNAPVFTKSHYAVNVSENTVGETFITKVSATDLDGDELMYSITKGNEFGFFTIEIYTGTIKTAKKLDYEIQSRFNIEVAVTDGRDSDLNRHTTKAIVDIGIIDEDDNSAVFQRNYSASIMEGDYSDEKLLQVHAEDLDSGVKAQIRYSIDRGTNPHDIFRIDQEGYIYVTGNIDREKKQQYKLTLLAHEETPRNSRFQSKPGKATLTVDVTDIDDNAPEFENEQYLATVQEHSPMDTKVIQVKAIDKDLGSNAAFKYEIRQDPENENSRENAFRITQDGIIKVQKDLDREIKYLHKFHVLAISLHDTKKFATCKVTVIVDDINDHSPKFTESIYTGWIKENAENGTVILTVKANDKDDFVHKKIRYSFIEDAEETTKKFKLDRINGIVTNRVSLDREERSEYSLLVQATDTDDLQKQRRATAKIKIYVEDVNDNAPMFKKYEYFKNLDYDVPPKTIVAKVEATDRDATWNGRVSYRIKSGNDLQKFRINKDTGDVTVSDSLANAPGQYRLEIEAYDHGEKRVLTSRRFSEIVINVERTGSNSVVLVMFARVADVKANEDEIIEELNKLLPMGIMIDHIEKGDSIDSTHFIVHGYDKSSRKVVRKENLIDAFYRTSARMQKFRKRWNITTWHAQKLVAESSIADNKKSEKWQPVIWAILGFSALVAMFGMFGIIYLIKSRRRQYDESGASLASSRIPIAPPPRKTQFWNDDKFESVSQAPESYMHSSGFLDTACDKYELDPSNLYNHSDTHLYEQDPFIDAERTSSSCSSESRASSRFAASSVVTTVCRSPSNLLARHSIPPKRLKSKCREGKRTATIDRQLSRERRLSIIEDDDGNPRTEIATKMKRPPSYEYDLDEKLPDKAPYYEQE